MIAIIALTLQEAAETLGLAPGASTADVNTAYRKLVAKYHPDANRSKSESEQKAAEQMFKKVNEAKKIMLKPELAADAGDPAVTDAPSSSRSSQPRTPQAASTQGARVRDPRAASRNTYHASAASSKAQPTGHNSATTFQSDVPKIPDPGEDSLAQIYRNETEKQYRKFSDKIRLTPSFIVTLVFLAYAMFSLITSGSVASLTMIGVLSVKAIYDVFFSYYVHNLITKRVMDIGWVGQCGIGCVLLSIIYLIVGMSAPGTDGEAADIAANVTNAVTGGRFAGVAANSTSLLAAMGIAILLGAGLIAIGVWLGKRGESRN